MIFIEKTFTLLVLILLLSCTKETHSGKGSKGRDIAEVKIKPILDTSLEAASFINFQIEYTLNNGKTITLPSALDLQKELEDHPDQPCSISKKILKKFDFIINNGYMKDGSIYIHIDSISADRHIFAVKIESKKNKVSDSVAIELPYLKNVEIDYSKTGPISPGFVLPLVVKALFNTGKELTLKPNQQSRLNPEAFIVEVNGQKVKYPYNYVLPPSKSFYNEVTASIHYKHYPSIKHTITVPLEYDGQYRNSFNGQIGLPGKDGADQGAANRFDGGEGGKGFSGKDGSPVNIYLLSYFHDERLYIKAVAQSGSNVSSCIFDPNKGSFNVETLGGKGGTGGTGGRGGDGADETETRNAQPGGDGGKGGEGGNGGNGGTVKIFTDEIAYHQIHKINVNNQGGPGGDGGDGGKNGTRGSKKNS
ncbi:MAG TPA: hypothetical protein VF691_12620, partial [Cytophagaceae bacterium]